MKKIFFFLLMVILTGTFFKSCYYDSKELLFPSIDNTCDTLNVKYSTSVDSVLTQYCTSCHSGTSASGNIRLDSYSNVKVQADNGNLMGTVTHSPGYKAMPEGTNTKLSDCTIAILQKWVDSGAPNN